MTDQQKQYALYGLIAVLLAGVVLWLVMLFWPKTAPTQPSLIDATRPQYDYNADSFVQQNPDMFLSQLVPLVGNFEAAVQKQEKSAIDEAGALLRKELVRWRDATPIPTLQTTIQRYIDATDRLTTDPKDGSALTLLNEIKTLALESQRASLQSLSR